MCILHVYIHRKLYITLQSVSLLLIIYVVLHTRTCTGETMVCTEDPKRSIGLWHGVMTAAYNGLHVVYVPPNVMSTLPTAWLHMIHKHKGTLYMYTHLCACTTTRVHDTYAYHTYMSRYTCHAHHAYMYMYIYYILYLDA